ncbi:MAG: ABC transporter permease [Patescibacteria group bacterium]|nr:ABC transporter permease [Patescibacteria group bacterium]
MNLTRIYAIVLEHLYIWSRSLSRLTDAFWWPLMDLFVWGLTTIFIQKLGGGVFANLLLVFLSGLIFWTVIYRSQYEISLVLAEEIWSRNLLNLFGSPLTIWEFITAGIFLSAVKLLAVLFSMSILAYLLYAYNILSLGFYLIPFVGSLAVFGWIAGIVINTLILRFGRDFEALAWTAVFMAQPFSCIFYPLKVLPQWAQSIALMLPSTYIFEGLRSLIYSGYFPPFNFWMSVILDAVYFCLSLLAFKSVFEKAKELGLLSRLLE